MLPLDDFFGHRLPASEWSGPRHVHRTPDAESEPLGPPSASVMTTAIAAKTLGVSQAQMTHKGCRFYNLIPKKRDGRRLLWDTAAVLRCRDERKAGK